MALLFMDSFDHYATADLLEKWTASGVTGTGSSLAVTSTAGRRGSGSFRWVTGTSSSASGYASRVLAPGDATCILGMALSVSAALVTTNGTGIVSIRDSASATQIALRINPDLTVTVGRSSSFTVLGTTSAALAVGAFTYVELRVKIDDVTGTVDMWFNGVNVLSLTGQDTRQGLAGWGSVVLGDGIGGVNNNPASRTFDYDDVYVLDGTGSAPWNAPLGDVRVDARVPTAPGATTGWTPSAGANWAAVDDAAPTDDTDYNATSTIPATDTFVYQDAPITGAVLYGVQHCLSMKKLDAGACTVAPVVRHAGVDYVGADLAPGTSYGYGLLCQQVNPGTGAQWTEAGFNAAEFGYKRTG